MYFLKLNPIKEKLRSRTVSDREALPYLIAFAVIAVLFTALPLVTNFNKWDFISTVVSLILGVSGIIYAYKCNGGKEGFDLIQKYTILGWVVVIRCLLFFIIPTTIAALTIGEFLGITTEDTGLFDIIMIAILEIFLYQRIGRHIRDTR